MKRGLNLFDSNNPPNLKNLWVIFKLPAFWQYFDPLEMVFIYEAYVPLRAWFNKNRIWNVVWEKVVIPELVAEGMKVPIPRLSDNDRFNCLSWYFALVEYTRELPYVVKGAVHVDYPSSIEAYCDVHLCDDTVRLFVPKANIAIRRTLLMASKALDNPFLEIDSYDDAVSGTILRHYWVFKDESETLNSLANLFNVLLENDWNIQIELKESGNSVQVQ
jgi:hypothetical protein